MRPFVKKLSNSIRGARKVAKLTQDELADMVGLSKASISGYETGRKTPSVETVALIAEACQIGISELIPKADLIPIVSDSQTTIYDYLGEDA